MLVDLKTYSNLNDTVGILTKINVDPEKPGKHYVYLAELDKTVCLHERNLKCVSKQVTSK